MQEQAVCTFSEQQLPISPYMHQRASQVPSLFKDPSITHDNFYLRRNSDARNSETSGISTPVSRDVRPMQSTGNILQVKLGQSQTSQEFLHDFTQLRNPTQGHKFGLAGMQKQLENRSRENLMHSRGSSQFKL